MGKQVVARMQGDDFQMRYFWLRALELITSDYVERVDLESSQVAVVDDVIVHYKGEAKRDVAGHFRTDYCQLKYHVTQGGAFSANALLDPEFTHTQEPLLVRLYRTYQDLCASDSAFRLRVVSCWGWDPADALASYLSTEGHFRDDLFAVSPRSAAGEILREWSARLGVGIPELQEFLRAVRFDLGAQSLRSLNDHLTDRLRLAGLRPLVPDQLHSPYDDLARKFLGVGLTQFNQTILLEVLSKEGLFARREGSGGQVTLRSRPQWAKKPVETQSAHLDLCEYFAERYARDPDVWRREIPAALAAFITPERLGGLEQPIEVFFDCHLSIALAAGSLLHPKCGLQLIPVQKVTGLGYEAWPCPAALPSASWMVNSSPGAGGSGAVVAVSVSHDVVPQVTAYSQKAALDHLPLIRMTAPAGTGARAVADAGVAWSLGVRFRQQLAAAVPDTTRELHVFFSGPAALAFILGTQMGGLPPVQLYEFDFEGEAVADRYSASLRLPIRGGNEGR